LGIAQRSVVVVVDFPSQRFSPRKLIPVNVKTLGDQLLLKRIEANQTQTKVAQIVGVSVRTVRKWEHGTVCPTEYHWQALSRIFSFDERRTQDMDPTPE
jgi:DNA-binding XRE family transcriptional regulator